MTVEILQQLMETLVVVDCNIYNKTITVEELKTLLLIIYYEILEKETPIPFLKDYITLVIKHFIELEEEAQTILSSSQKEEDTQIVKNLFHERITTSSWEE